MTCRQKWSVPRRRESNRLTFYKTLFARMGNIKAGKYVSDDGEDLNDTEKVLKKNGILLRNSTNEFRSFGDVLDEVAGKWESYDNVTQHAIATAFAGTRQQEKFFVLMENYGKALEYEAVAAESAGTANQKYTDAYLDSIEARKNAMKASYESLSQTVLNSDVVKGIYVALTGIISALDWIASTWIGKGLMLSLVVGGIFKLLTGIPTVIKAIGTGLSTLKAKINGTTTATQAATAAATAWNLALMGVALVVGIVVSAVASSRASTKSFAETLEETRSKIQETSSELSNLRSRLDEIKSRINEINNKPLKNIADMNELKKLQKELGEIEARISRAEEREKRLARKEQREFVAAVTVERILSPMEMAKGVLTMEEYLDKLSEFQGNLEYVENPTTDLERQVNDAIRYIDRLYDRYDLSHNPEGLFERIFNRAYFGEARESILDVVNPEELKKLYDANPAVKEFVDYIFSLAGLKAEDDSFVLLFNQFVSKELISGIKETTSYVETLYDTLSGKDLDEATESVKALASAIEEMDGSGKISLETAEKLAELGEEYVDAISIENGELRVNTDLLRSMAVEKYELAKATAISNGATEQTIALYDMLIQKTKELGSGDALTRANSLLDYENAILEFAGGADYDQRRLTNTGRQRENVLKQIEYLRAHGYSSDSDEIMSLYKQYIEYTERMISLNKEFASQEEDDIKSAIEAENDELEEQKNLLDDIIDARKKALDLAKDENRYQNELASKQKKVGDLQTQLAAARLDTSAAGRARVRKLEEQLADAQSDLDDFNLEHATDVIADKLDAEKEENEALYEKQKADNDLRLDQLIAENKALIDQYETNLKEEIDIVGDALGNIDLDINDPESGIANTLTDIEDIIQRIEGKIGQDNLDDDTSKPGSDLMFTSADIEEWKHERRSSGKAPGIKANDTVGKEQITLMKWISLLNSGVPLSELKARYTYHSGGIVDDLGLGDNEVFAKLMKGEYVATPAQMSNFLRKTLPNMAAAGGQQFNAPLIAVNCESVNEESLPKLETIIKSAADRIKAELTSAFDKTGFRSPNKRILAY